ncbi:MAG: N-6 DNA methylase [Gammaproteobacteria bacterium]
MLTRDEGHRVGATVLQALGYSSDQCRQDYPVWLGGQELTLANLVAFGRNSPLDMTTATAVIEVSENHATRAKSIEVARALAAPMLVLLESSQLSISMVLLDAEPNEIARLTYDDETSLRRLSSSIGPTQLLQAKLGQRQHGLFPVDVRLLESARQRSEQRLTPLVNAALETAAKMSRLTLFEITGTEQSERLHKQAARIVVGALTALALRDKEGLQDLSPAALADMSQQRYSGYFRWLQAATTHEHRTLEAIISALGDDVNYRSLDPRVLASVYENSLVTDAHRKTLGTHYTPSGLARLMLQTLPIESLRPDSRLVLDPTCGSGGLLLAAHDRLRDLQPPSMDPISGHDETVAQLRGLDKDNFAVELTRLSLLLNAYPAGNGWHISQADVLETKLDEEERPSVIVANPPWRNSNTAGARRELAEQFLQWMVRTLVPGGLLAVVMPVGWLNNRNSRVSRSSLQSQCDILEVWRLPETLFESSSMAPTVLMAQKKQSPNSHQLSRFYKRVVRRVAVSDFYASGQPDEVTLQVDLADPSSPIVAGPLLSTFANRVRWPRLDEQVDVITGPQPNTGVSNRSDAPPGTNALFLPAAGKLPHFGEADPECLIQVNFPGDFQQGSRRGEAGLGRQKVLVSAVRSADNPWRLRVGIDQRGILARNSLQMLVPREDRYLFGLMAFLGSTFAAAWIDESVPDRNISTADIRSMPIPQADEDWRELSSIGERLFSAALIERDVLVYQLEEVVWSSMKIDSRLRAIITERFAGFADPDGIIRHSIRTRVASRDVPSSASRNTFGATRDVRADEVQVVIPGLTEESGIWIRPPGRMSGWMLQRGSTFAAQVPESELLDETTFAYQQNSWLDDHELEARVRALQSTDQS